MVMIIECLMMIENHGMAAERIALIMLEMRLRVCGNGYTTLINRW